MSWECKEFVRPICDDCGEKGDADEYTWWEDDSLAAESYTESYDWFFRREVVAITYDPGKYSREVMDFVEVLCPKCVSCEVCGASDAYKVGRHLVCEDHEDHEFSACPTCGSHTPKHRPSITNLAAPFYHHCTDDFHGPPIGLMQHLSTKEEE